MLLLDDGRGGVLPVHPGWCDRLAGHWNSVRIDQELAAGASPDSTPDRALRAEILMRMSTRRKLALGLQRVVSLANNPTAGPAGGGPITRADVLRAGRELEELSALLVSDAPVSVRGIAQTELLLTAPRAGLHGSRAGDDLRRVVRGAIEAISPVTD